MRISVNLGCRSLKKEQKLKKKKADAWKERKDQQRQNANIKQKK